LLTQNTVKINISINVKYTLRQIGAPYSGSEPKASLKK